MLDKVPKDIPVIFISALSETIDKVKAFRVGGVDYVTKPFQFEEVYARIQTHLQLRRLEKLRDDLTHMVIHDLRSPLTGIFGFLDILEFHEVKNLSESTMKFIKLARISAEDMYNMISSILDVSKMSEGEMKLQLSQCDIYGIISCVAGTIQPLIGKRTVTFDVSGSLTITADAVLIRRVVQNLLSNAIKYTPADGEVSIAVTSANSEVRITITDTGPGIAPEYHQRIFEKFGQVEDRKCRLGTGLGLTFCKMAVEAHGGRIGVDSEVDKGSTFWFVLPMLNKAQEYAEKGK